MVRFVCWEAEKLTRRKGREGLLCFLVALEIKRMWGAKSRGYKKKDRQRSNTLERVSKDDGKSW